MSAFLPFAAVVLVGAAVVAHQLHCFAPTMPDDPVLDFRLIVALHEEAEHLAEGRPCTGPHDSEEKV